MTRTRLFIADDHAVVRSGLKLILQSQPDLELVGEAATGEEAVAQILELRPEIVLLDIGLPGMTGLQAAQEIRERAPEVRIVLLTMYNDDAYLQQALRIGAQGYVLKQAADSELIAAIRAVQRGESFIYPSLTGQLINLYLKQTTSAQQSAGEAQDELSPRENEVLRLVALGYTSQQVARQLGISVSTVETHRERLMDKLKLKGRAQLVRYALSRGLLEDEGH